MLRLQSAIALLALLAACGADDQLTAGDSSASEPTGSSVTTTVAETSDTLASITTPMTSDPTTETTDATSSDASTSSTTGDPDSSTGSSSETSTTGSGAALVVLNELSSNNGGALGEDPIELYNGGTAEADLSGWILTDDVTDPYDPDADMEEFVFPDGTTLAAGAFVVVVGATADGHTFGLSGAGDTVRLFDADLEEVDTVTYADGEAAISYCRMPDGPDGTWQADCAETFGMGNG